MIDNHIYWGNALDIDLRRITWRRAMDMNDRALRQWSVLLAVSPTVTREKAASTLPWHQKLWPSYASRRPQDLERRLGISSSATGVTALQFLHAI